MEKIIFVGGTTLSINAIKQIGDQLVVSVHNGDFADLETRFSNKENLEKVILADEQDNKMAAFKNYSILRQITKRKNVIIDEIEETTADIIDVTLQKESEVDIALRKLKEEQEVQGGAIADLGAVTSDLAEKVEGGMA